MMDNNFTWSNLPPDRYQPVNYALESRGPANQRPVGESPPEKKYSVRGWFGCGLSTVLIGAALRLGWEAAGAALRLFGW